MNIKLFQNRYRAHHVMASIKNVNGFAEKKEQSYFDLMGRQLPLIGKKGQKNVRSTRLTVIGLGGNGSAFTRFAALVGFRKMKLFDSKKLKLTNLNRNMFAGVKDLNEYKVIVAKRKLKILFPDMEVDTFPNDVRAPGMWQGAKECDWLIDSTDDDQTRKFLQEQCSSEEIPLISMASGFTFRDGCLVNAGSRVNRVQPELGDACLQCQALGEAPMEQTHVSLVIPNVIAAALAVDTLLRELTEYPYTAFHIGQTRVQSQVKNNAKLQQTNNFLLFDLVNRRIMSERIIPSPSCPICGNPCSKLG